MSVFVPSKYQKRIFEEVQNTNNNIIINATAGAGKSTTLLRLLDIIPSSKDCIFLAFNKSIADELRNKAPKYVQVSTIHSFGCQAMFRMFPGIKIDENKYFKAACWLFHTQWKNETKEKRNFYCYRVTRLVELACLKMSLEPEKMQEIADEYDIEIYGNEIQHAIQLYDTIYEDTNRMSFTDMIHQPAIRRMKLKKFDFVLLDECLPYHMPVLLSDGSSKTIGEIVENKLNLEVLSFNIKTGKQEKCKIINWSKTINDKKMFKIKGRSDKHLTSFVVCTYNHRIWTTKGYVEAQNIKPGMTLQFETSAEKTQKYKITKAGCAVVRNTMQIKNANYTVEERKNMTKNNSKENFHKNKGGNGRINVLQKMFFEALTGNWEMELPIPTKKKMNSGYPTNYKIDIGNKDLLIGLELDGASHKNEIGRARDLKKDELLTSLGWNIIRIKNEELIKDFNGFAEFFNDLTDKKNCEDGENCPIDMVVESIEEAETKEMFVYDITIEKCHNFYANGILVHNCQDVSNAQQCLIKKIVKPITGRFIGCGDPDQSIYGFAGANYESYENFKTLFPNTIELPLNISYRCPKEGVKLAKTIVSRIEAHPKAIQGKITYKGKTEDITDDAFVICRNTKPLVDVFRELISQGKKANIKGREIGTTLVTLITRTKAVTIDQLLTRIAQQQLDLRQKLFKKGYARPEEHSSMQKLIEKKEIIKILSQDSQTINKLINRIEEIFTDDDIPGITLSTLHKIKGLENDTVFFLNRGLIPSKYATTAKELIQEQNLLFIAYTRFKKELIFIDI